MISQKDIKTIDTNYFKIIQSSGFTLTLRSKNTEHEWHIIALNYPHHESYELYHRHKGGTYHFQRFSYSISTIQKYIKSHDAYFLQKKHAKRQSQRDRMRYLKQLAQQK